MQRAHTSPASGLVVVLATLVLAGSLATAFLLQARRQIPLPGAPQASAAARTTGADRVAQASARNALAAALTAFTDRHTFSTVTPHALEQIEPDLTFTLDPSTSPAVASVATTDQRVGVAVRSASGVCWLVSIDETAGGTTRYGAGADPCTGELALGAAQRTW
ncbi:MAG: hypothetical protein ACM3OO_12140 [Planctomycetaceae bacterium]